MNAAWLKLCLPVADVGVPLLEDALLACGALSVSVVDGHSTIGGGSAPGSALATRLVAVTHASLSASRLEAHLRSRDLPIIARIEHGQLLLDLRTVDPRDDAVLAAAFDGLPDH